MRWEDERYVRVYTRDTGDWLGLSFEAQAVFLMLLRKVDRIGQLRLGRRGRSSIPACIGHSGKEIDVAIDELISDGCVRLSTAEDQLFIPNFLKAQDTPKSPALRKAEQRERDAAQAAENTSDVTHVTQPVTKCHSSHEMSPRAVPCLTVPNRAVPNHLSESANAHSGSDEFGPEAIQPIKAKRARKAKEPSQADPRHQPLVDALAVAFLEVREDKYSFTGKDMSAVQRLLRRSPDDAEIVRRWRVAMTHPLIQQRVFDLAVFESRWNTLGKKQPDFTQKPIDFRKAPVRAEDTPKEAFAQTGRINDF